MLSVRMSHCSCDHSEDELRSLIGQLSELMVECTAVNSAILGLCNRSGMLALVLAAANLGAGTGMSDADMLETLDEALRTTREQVADARQRQASTHQGSSSVN